MKDIIMFLWIGIFVLVLFLLYRFCLFIRSIYFEKRVSNYTVDSLDRDLSIFDSIEFNFNKLCKKIARYLEKKKTFSSYAKRYYDYKNGGYYFIVLKLLTGVSLFVLSLVISILLSLSEGILISTCGLLIGYYIPDIYYYFYKKQKEKIISKDLIKVITLMNHSFQSGKSIVQAIEVVANEIDGPLKKEFLKMKMDLTFGLDFETVFKRFYERVPLEDVKYLTTSLIVFNKTGGNIVTIFKLIEKNFYTRQELKKELESTTSSARLIFQLLTFLPLFMVVLISMLTPDYFMVLFTNVLGILLLICIVIIYIGYILIIKKLLKIEYK